MFFRVRPCPKPCPIRQRFDIDGLRQGRIALKKGQWIEVTDKEREVIELMRAGEYGEMTVQFTKGQPKISRVTLDFRHGKLTERQAALALLPRMREKYEEESLSLQ